METEQKNEQVSDFLKQMKENSDLSLVEASLVNNTIEFTVGTTAYRVSKPTFSQLQEIANKKLEKYNQLLLNPIFLFEKDLKLKLKAKNVDLDEIQKEIDTTESKKKSLQFKLGELLVKNESETDLKNLKEEIVEITKIQNQLTNEKNSYLELSLEQQLNNHLYAYLTYIATEHKVEDKWQKVWSQFSDFEKSDNSELVRNAAFYTTLISLTN